jgi:hypothetical protein
VQWVALAIALTFLVAVIAPAVIPVRLALSVKGHGEFGKYGAFALGARLWFVTVAYADAFGADSLFQVLVFGQRVFHRSPVGKQQVVDEADEHKMTLKELLDKAPIWRDKVERWIDLGDVLRFVVDLRHHIRMERLNGRLSYATPDVAVTGMISGSLFTMAGLLAPFGVFLVEPQWVDVAKAAGNLDVVFRFYPTRIVLYAIVFAFKNIKLRQRETPGPAPAQS